MNASASDLNSIQSYEDLSRRLTTEFDGSGRPIRDVQRLALEWAAQQIPHHKVIAIQAPTGSGKSGIARALQAALGGAIITPTNPLLDQYTTTYNSLNFLKGRSHYECENGMTCDDKRELKQKPCEGCPYLASRRSALKNEPTVFNPISMFYLTQSIQYKPYKTLIIDEAHKLLEMLELLTSIELRKGRYQYPPDIQTPTEVSAWIKELVANLVKLRNSYLETGQNKEASKLTEQIQRLGNIKVGLDNDPDLYVIYREERPYRQGIDEYLVIKPLEVPRSIVNQLLGKYERIILLSATLPRSWVKQLTWNADFAYLDLPSPIPVENRQILVDPQGLTAKSDPTKVTDWILKHWRGENAIVHLSYSMAHRVHKILLERGVTENVWIHTTDTKTQTLENFKSSGGLWLAGGCAEGIDLPYGEATLNLIPYLLFPNLGDQYVNAKRGRIGGQVWYELTTLVQFIQQAGRTTRASDDFSKTVTGDARLFRLIGKYRKEIPDSFIKALKVWPDK